MKLIPSGFKYKKHQKGKSFKKIKSIIFLKTIKFNTVELISCEAGRISMKQFNSICLSLKKSIKKIGFVNFKIFPHTPITKKPIEVRMGKGKGNVDHWAFKCKIGTPLLTITTSYKKKSSLALKAAQIKLSIKTKIKSSYAKQ